MDWVDLAVKLIAPMEGLHKIGADGLVHPYLDRLAKPNVWTRGYGRTYGISEDSAPITKARALDELREGVRAYGLKCLALAPALADRPHCLAAVTSWAWNCGIGAFKNSRLRKAINAGQWERAAELIRKPDTAGGVVYRGLQRRRSAEAALFVVGFRT
jgi:lysozyme